MHPKVFVLALVTAVSGACFVSPANAACDQRSAEQAVKELNKMIAALVQFTPLSCAATVDEARCAVMCIAPYRQSEDNINLLLTTITAGGAVSMRKVGVSKFSRLTFGDRNLLERRRYLTITASNADKVQAAIVAAPAMPPLQLAAKVRTYWIESGLPQRK